MSLAKPLVSSRDRRLFVTTIRTKRRISEALYVSCRSHVKTDSSLVLLDKGKPESPVCVPSVTPLRLAAFRLCREVYQVHPVRFQR